MYSTSQGRIEMDVSLPRTEGADAAVSKVEIPQYGLPAILAVWAAAALPIAALAWLAAPALEDHLGGAGDVPMFKALIICLTAGLIWQFVLVVVLVWREQRTLRWPIVREALWLRSPRDPKSGRRGGRVWLILIPLIVLFAIESILPTPPHADNTVLGEELLFRGLLLPRMNGAFGRWDWVANGLLFAAYHLHVPWVIPATLLDTFIIAYPAKRYRSAWIGIVVHSAQSVVLAIIVLTYVV
jgi:CAAX protease family protein